MREFILWGLASSVVLAACGSAEPVPLGGGADAAIIDAPVGDDASAADAGSLLDASDPSPLDASAPDPFDDPQTLDDERVRALDPTQLLQATTPCRAPVLARVRYAVDGDTLAVTLEANQTEERIRIIGVNSPEISHGAGQVDECYGPEAHDFTRPLAGHLVWLTFDRLCIDPYDRTLAFVHVAASPAGIWERQMVRRGFGRAYVIGRNRTIEADITADETVARTARAGLWGACP